MRAKLDEWFAAGLQDWDISRDAPYFGFEVPDAPGKYFYVWFDAPIGYIASFEAWRAAPQRGLGLRRATGSPRRAPSCYHFIGKDISYFHNLFWPAVLHGAGLRRPTGGLRARLSDHQGQKMSKSRGTFITARRYLERLPPEPLRYYFAAKLGSGIEDIDFSLDDFWRAPTPTWSASWSISPAAARASSSAAAAAWPAALPEPALYRRVRRAGRAHRRALRAARIRHGDPRDHGAGRSRQPVHRSAQALGARQGSGASRRGARHRHPRHQPVSRADELPDAGAAADGARRPAQFLGVEFGDWERIARRCSAAGYSPISRWRDGWMPPRSRP